MSSSPSFDARQPSQQSVWGLSGLIFFLANVRHGVGPLLSAYLHTDLKWDPSKIGLALAMTDVSSIFSLVPAGLLVDAVHYKRKLITFSCLFIMGGCALILNWPSLWIVLIAQLFMGVAIALISPTLGAITIGLFGRLNYPKRTSKNEMIAHTGKVVTALSAGTISYLLGNQWIFYLVILCALISLISLSFIRPTEINYRVAREMAEDRSTGLPLPPTSLRQLFKRKAILIFNLSFIFYYLSNAAQFAMVGQVLANQHPQQTALLLAGCMLIAEITMIAAAFVMGLVVNRFGRKPIFLTAFLILPIRALLYTLTDQPALLLSIQLLDGVAAGIIGVIGTVINSDLAIGTGRFNFLQGLGSLSASIGSSLSNVAAGWVAASFGFNISFLALAGIGLVGASIFGLLMPETKPTSD